jgi:nitrogen-specific signal transduction histidine kinase/HAMP domain-containing protein
LKKPSKLLRKVLILPLLVVAISIILIAIFLSFYVSNQTLNETIGNVSQNVDMIINTFDSYISSTENLTKIFSNSFEAQGGDTDSLLLNLKKVLSSNDLYIDSFVSDVDGYCKDVNGRVFYLDQKTNLLLQSNSVVTRVIKSPPWEDGGLPVLRIGSPINIYGNFQGGVFFDISLNGEKSKIYNLLAKSSTFGFKDEYGFALTQTGTTIIHKNLDFVWVNVKSFDHLVFQTPIVHNLPNILKYKLYGSNKIAVGKTDPITKLKFYITVYKSSILKDIDLLTFYVFLIFTLVAIAVVLILFFQIHPITRYMLKINDFLKQVSLGDYDSKIEINTNTEIDDVALNLNIMVKSVKDSMQQVHSLKEYMENLLNSLSELIITANEDGKIEFANIYAKNICNSDDLSNMSIYDFLDKKNIEIYFDKDDLLSQQNTIYFPDVLIDDKVFDVYVKSQTYSKNKFILFVAYDVTKRIELENHLSQIQKIQSIGLMAAGIAHDFNNFLASMLGNLELFELSRDENEKLEYINKIYFSIHNAKNMVKKLLVFTKESVTTKTILDIKSIIIKTVQMLDSDIQGKNISLNLDLLPNLKGEMDETELIQILSNILINSIQELDDSGAITIKTELIHLDDKLANMTKGDYVKILINDNGSGMPKENLQKIFDPFFTTKENSSGLGLYVSKILAQRNGGDVLAFSKVGLGTTIEVYLPLYYGEPNIQNQDDKKYVYGKDESLLLIDDDDVFRNVVGKMLTKLHYSVHIAKSVDEGIEVLKQKNIDLILLDVVMPNKNAYDFMEFMNEESYEMPVIIISGYPTNISKLREFKFYKDFLPKPFGMKTLSLTIYKHLRK